jgi:hypothetical protein
MLPSNFENIAAHNPDLDNELREIGAWIDEHSSWSLLDPRVLAEDLPSLGAESLVRALDLLVASGLFDVRYQIESPSGVLCPQDFNDPGSIPGTIYDRWDNPVETSDYNLVAVLKPSAESHDTPHLMAL